MKDEDYKEHIISIINDIMPSDEFAYSEKMAIIGSNSVKSMLFLSEIEEEFDIEIDDEFLNHRFFTDIDYVTSCVKSIITLNFY